MQYIYKPTGQKIRINRNIVECKEFYVHGSPDRVQRINRNIVECKDQQSPWHDQRIAVLIET